MTEQIKNMFYKNINLLDRTDKAILYFREQNYRQALEYMPGISESMRELLDGIISNREYFELDSVDSLIEMLEGILEAGRLTDYVLLADLLELQLSTLLCNVQEVIMKKEDASVFDEETYQLQCGLMTKALERAGNEAADLFEEPLNPEELLEKGYRVEYTSCGLMTVAVGTDKGSLYLHTNHKASREAFLLARSWVNEGTETYLVRGFGMGYRIGELAMLTDHADICVYEQDARVLKLACAFAPLKELLENERILLVFDEDGTKWQERCSALLETEKICLHMPSVHVYENTRKTP